MRAPDIDRLSAALAPHDKRIATPALVIDEVAVRHNIRAVIARLDGDTRRWRPHIKTDKQAAILDLLREEGVEACKCATVDELSLALEQARARSSAADVVVAYPLHGANLRGALALRARYPQARVQLLVDSPAHAQIVNAAARERAIVLQVQLDVDLGMGRTGSPPAVWREAVAALAELANLEITGLHGYDGHHSWEARAAAHAGYDQLIALADVYGPGPLELITSGTHSYAHALAHEGLGIGHAAGTFHHQISPGTVVLSDRRSHRAAADLGLVQAAFVLARVVSRDEVRVTLDAGSKAIAPDCPPPTCAVLDHPELTPQAPSEEHLPLSITRPPGPSLGELVWLVPEHVCTTVNLHRAALLVDASGEVRTSIVRAGGRYPWITPT
ncbi:MAG: alanine racemase [Myxococcales bacterium]|nr:alanine racemase [Myxococcales bacterium]